MARQPTKLRQSAGIILLLLALLSFSPTQAHPALHHTNTASCRLGSFEATYSLKHKSQILGSSQQKLTISAQRHYQFNTQTSLHVFIFRDHIDARSRGRIGPDGFIAHRFRVIERSKKQHRYLRLKPGQDDSLSFLLNLRYRLLTGKPLGKQQVWINHKLETLSYHLIPGKHPLLTPLGRLATTEVRYHNKDGIQFTLWFANALHFLLLKTSIAKQGHPLTSTIISSYHPLHEGACAIS